MTKRTRLIIIAIIALLFVGVGFYKWNASQVAASQLDDTDYSKGYAQAVSSGRPTIVFLTVSDGCCEATVVVLEEIKAIVAGVAKEWENKLNFISIDLSRLSERAAKAVGDIANEHGIRQVPATLVLDSNGKRNEVIIGSVDASELDKIIREVVR